MEKPTYDVKEFIEEVMNVVIPDDMDAVRAFLLQFDNMNLVNILNKSDEHSEMSLMSREELSGTIKTPELLPRYMGDFLESIREEKRCFPNLSIENELSVYYYRYLTSMDNEFISSFYLFDALLRNVISALNSKKYEYSIEKNVLPMDEDDYAQIIKSSAADFGLSGLHPWVSDLLTAFQAEKHVDLARKADQLRFQKIDDLLFFDWFSVNTILAYMIKLIIIEKWSRLKKPEGSKDFEQRVNTILEQEDFLKQFRNIA
jgi:hypothetical protein